MEDYSKLIDEMTWSYSRIKCYSDCPYRFFLKYIYGCESTPKFYSSYGSYLHQLIQERCTETNGKTNGDYVIEFLTGFSNNVLGERPKESTVQKYIDCGVRYLSNFEPFKYPVKATEERMEFQIDGIPFVGIIDYLGELDGEYHIIDHKSRDLKPRSKRKKPTVGDIELDDMLRQLYIYSAAVKQKYGKFPKTLSFNCFKEGLFIEEPFREETYDEAVRWAKSEIKWIKRDMDFSPRVDYFTCKFICDCSEECCYFG